MISAKRPSLRSQVWASIWPSAMAGKPPASAIAAANAGTSLIQDMAPWINGNLMPISRAKELSRKQFFFLAAATHNFFISAMKAFTACPVPVPKRSANAAAEADSTPSGIISFGVK